MNTFLLLQVILELCRNEETANILCVQPHLERIHPPGYTGVSVSTILNKSKVQVQSCVTVKSSVNEDLAEETFHLNSPLNPASEV